MLCPTCGTDLEHPGQGHTCRNKDAPPPEPAELAVASRRLVAFTAAFAVASVIVAVLVAVLTAAGVPDPSESPGSRVLLLIGVGVTSLVALGALAGLGISAFVWGRLTNGMAAASGANRYHLLGYWGRVAFSFTLILSYFLPAALDTGTTTKLIVQVALRLFGAVLLILGVRHTRAWLRGRADPSGEPYQASLYSLTTGGQPATPLSPTPSGDDWDASVWDPDVLRDIDRRRHRPED